MKYVTNILLIATIITMSVLVLVVSTAHIVNAETEDSTVAVICDPATDPDCADPVVEECGKSGSGDCGLFDKYINPMIVFLSAFVGIAVTIGLVYGAIQYTSAGSDPGAVSKAKNTIKNSIVALIAFLFLLAMMNWLVPGGLV